MDTQGPVALSERHVGVRLFSKGEQLVSAARNRIPHFLKWSMLVLAVVGLGIAIIATRVNGTVKPVSAASMPPGLAAIHVSKSGVPAFTTADVQAYLDSNPFPGGPTLKGSKPAVAQIAFASKEQAITWMRGESLDELPAHAAVCYVRLSGPFSSQHIHAPKGATLSTVFQTGYMVFDAQTGNLLVWGLLP